VRHRLCRAYVLKEGFEAFYTSGSAEEAAQFLKGWTRRCKQINLLPFIALGKRLTRWSSGILMYFTHRITNGVSESINNLIKVIKRRAYGFHDFAYFCLKILDATGTLPPLASLTTSMMIGTFPHARGANERHFPIDLLSEDRLEKGRRLHAHDQSAGQKSANRIPERRTGPRDREAPW